MMMRFPAVVSDREVDVADVVRRLSFDPRSKAFPFTLSFYPEIPPLGVGADATSGVVCVSIRQPDMCGSGSLYEIPILSTRTCLRRMREIDAVQFIVAQIVDLYRHELCETIRLDGERIFDPHAGDSR